MKLVQEGSPRHHPFNRDVSYMAGDIIEVMNEDGHRWPSVFLVKVDRILFGDDGGIEVQGSMLSPLPPGSPMLYPRTIWLYEPLARKYENIEYDALKFEATCWRIINTTHV